MNPSHREFIFLSIALLSPSSPCPSNILKRISQNEFNNLPDYFLKNHITGATHHLITCKTCQKYIPEKKREILKKLYYEALFRRSIRLNFLRKLESFSKKNTILILLLKDYPKRRKKNDVFIPLQFDIDILCKKESFSQLSDYLKQMGYVQKKRPSGWPVLPRSYYTQIKFIHPAQRHPQVEVRLEALTFPRSEKSPFRHEIIPLLTQHVWQHLQNTETHLYLSNEYSIFLYSILFFFEDNLKSLHNSYRLNCYLQHIHSYEKYKIIMNYAKEFHLENEVAFVLSCVVSFFPNKIILSFIKRWQRQNSAFEQKLFRCLSQRLINWKYTTRVYQILEIGSSRISQERDGYVFFLVTWLLYQKTFLEKLFFFSHPKRLMYLFLFSLHLS